MRCVLEKVFVYISIFCGSGGRSSRCLEEEEKKKTPIKMHLFQLVILIAILAVVTANQITLTYFNGKGLGEVSRMMLGILGIPFEDIRAGKDFVWADEKHSGKYDANLKRLPVMNWNGFNIGQSKPIERLIGKTYGYLGESAEESALIEAIVEHISDIKQAYRDMKKDLDGEELAAATNDFINGDGEKGFREWITRLENTLSGEPGFSIGDKLSLADLHLYMLKTYILDGIDGVDAALLTTPKIASVIANVAEIAKDYHNDARFSQGEF
jgi:hypothetical protein